MKCLLWYREKKDKEPKLYLSIKGMKKEMSKVLKSVLKVLG